MNTTSTMPVPETTIYLGKTAEGLHVWAEVEVRNGSDLRTDRDPNQMHQTTGHEMIREADLTSASVSFVVARRKASTVATLRSNNFDGWVESSGQTPAEDRVIAHRAPGLSAEDLALIESMSSLDNLNTMNAGCDHNTGPDAATIASPDFPQRYGGPDVTGWRIEHDACPETGYRWGSAWLVRTIPADRLAAYQRVAAEHAYPLS